MAREAPAHDDGPRGGAGRDDAGHYDAVIVGGGNAGLCAAHAARETGARVLLLEKSPADEAGGNSFYSAGAFRVPHHGLDDLVPLLGGPDSRLPVTVIPPYPESDFTADMYRVTGGRCDPQLTSVLVSRAAGTVRWLAAHGIRWRLMYERQAYFRDGRWMFFGGLPLGAAGGGKGLIAQHTSGALTAGTEIRYRARLTGLVRGRDTRRVAGVRYADGRGTEHRVSAGAVILAAEGRGFCAGVDIKQMQQTPGHEALLGANRGCFAAFAAVYECAVPVIAAVHGFCLGGGVGLAGSADIVIASDDATFGLPESWQWRL